MMMRNEVCYVVVVLCSLHTVICQPLIYSDQWAVHVEGGPQRADQIAKKHGFVNRGQFLYGKCERMKCQEDKEKDADDSG
uniref:Peptidase S8 pro-domain domain-containing protein n=1 Tax=Strigamia maritima TaxID=126957 RepID=T1JMY2_STRMM